MHKCRKVGERKQLNQPRSWWNRVRRTGKNEKGHARNRPQSPLKCSSCEAPPDHKEEKIECAQKKIAPTISPWQKGSSNSLTSLIGSLVTYCRMAWSSVRSNGVWLPPRRSLGETTCSNHRASRSVVGWPLRGHVPIGTGNWSMPVQPVQGR